MNTVLITLIPVLIILGVLVSIILQQYDEIKEMKLKVKELRKENEDRFWKEMNKTEQLINALERNDELERRLKETKPKEPHKMTIDVELNTEQVEKDMERLKKIIGICKHQNNCTFFEIGEDSHNSQ
jgi:predicted Holliday junction resolvase-like endonuclease